MMRSNRQIVELEKIVENLKVRSGGFGRAGGCRLIILFIILFCISRAKSCQGVTGVTKKRPSRTLQTNQGQFLLPNIRLRDLKSCQYRFFFHGDLLVSIGPETLNFRVDILEDEVEVLKSHLDAVTEERKSDLQKYKGLLEQSRGVFLAALKQYQTDRGE